MTKKEAILFVLKDRKWHDNREVMEVGGFCYTARISNLRADGYIIECRHVKDGKFEYRLAGRKEI